MKRTILLFFSLVITIFSYSQASLEQITSNLKWRNIGPANQGGRIVDIEALENDFTKVFIAKNARTGPG